MPWTIDPTDNTSLFPLPASLHLRLREGVGVFILDLQRGREKPIESWVLNTPSIYEARKQAMSIIVGHCDEMIRYVTCQLPVLLPVWPYEDTRPIIGCPPSPCRPSALPREECNCSKCRPVVHPYAIR